MALTQELKKNLETMDEKWLKLIQTFYENNPKTKEACKDVSDFVDELLKQKIKHTS